MMISRLLWGRFAQCVVHGGCRVSGRWRLAKNSDEWVCVRSPAFVASGKQMQAVGVKVVAA